MHMRYREQLAAAPVSPGGSKDFPLEPAEVSPSSEAGQVAAQISSSQSQLLFFHRLAIIFITLCLSVPAAYFLIIQIK